MRNVFDQYDQQENKLTHALVSALHANRNLVRPFLKWLGVANIPPVSAIHVEQQQMPGEVVESTDSEKAVPDACFFDREGWCVLIESKIQSGISVPQLRRHQRMAARHGYENAQVFLFAVDQPKRNLPTGIHYRDWKSVYAWFVRQSKSSEWARRFAEYVEVFESKMNAEDYNIKGTLTMFNGFHFDEDHPYTYREGKRLLGLVRGELVKHRRLIKTLGLDPDHPGRPAITMDENGTVWNFIPLRNAGRSGLFTNHPHFTVALTPGEIRALVSVPNSIKPSVKQKLKKTGFDHFNKLLFRVGRNAGPVVGKLKGARIQARAYQRHYKSQRSQPDRDGLVEFDLRVLGKNRGGSVKYQPTWGRMIYELMTEKRTNIQLSLEAYLPYSTPVMQTEKAIDIIAETWIAMKPFLDFVR